ncbi:methyl-accepting chemotaxis protein [Paractinoplanes hotanensis]|uniref:Methyl-accepting chemotaxis protein n=1 Tax=Paractinoplanes hotanensis TaxID=2906497 RepID=A0ABT0YA20_9ACTN|nr:methyl-accepting chemotaxis protein [Actinoplanes hotanensis]MCM4082889.1 methyl-accepting chemotaxis protein [Actinoplanes hotanensis]
MGPSRLEEPGHRHGLIGWVSDLRVSTKILTSVMVVAALGTGVSSFAAVKLAQINQNTNDVYGGTVQLETIAEMRNAFNRVRIDSLDHFVTADDKVEAEAEKAIAADVKTLAETESRYKSFELGPVRIEALATFDRAWAKYLDVLDNKLLPASRVDDAARVAAIRENEVDPLVAQAREAMDTLAAQTIAHAEEAQVEAQAAYETARTLIIALIVAGLLLGVGLAMGVARLITKPLARAVKVLLAIRDGDLTARTGMRGKDEVGRLAEALDTSTESMAVMVRQVGDNARHVAAASEELSAVSVQMSSAAEETSAQAGTVSSAAGMVSQNVQTVAAGADEMGVAIREIATSATQAASVSAQAAQTADKTNEIVAQLGRSSAEISSVVQLITSIAGQTNLLALNATIEAARAGEMGKGFAVVASEVKDLAQETARATDDISRRIGAIQHETEQAVAAIGEITEVTARINDHAATIAAAVEEQTATTNEMARSVAEASSSANDIAGNIAGVAQAADATATGATETQATAQELARMAEELHQTISVYRV